MGAYGPGLMLQATRQNGQSFAQQGSNQRIVVPYMDLSGGLNTRKDAHALNRNELAVLQNAWYAYGQSLGKRPGLTSMVSVSGATGAGTGIISIIAARFQGISYLVIQDFNGNIYYAPAVDGKGSAGAYSWTQIGSISKSGVMRGAQMYDPQRNSDCLFIVSGQDVPQFWQGPGDTSLHQVDTSVNHLPTQTNSLTLPITPAYVATLGNNSHLFYSGDPTAPSAVYISDPFFPESFSTPLTQVNPMKGAYNPALVGNNDGVDGGAITGMQTLGSSMLIFKQSAVYVMVETQLFGDVAFQVQNVSSTVGCLSPRSIVAMDGFVCFLAVDGIYMTDGNTCQQISGNVPTFFDSTVSGSPALISDRTTAIAARHGTRYLIFFDSDGDHDADMGVWLDFAVEADRELPGAGQIIFSNDPGYTPLRIGGLAALRGPLDDGNLAICAGNWDFVGKFGLGFADVNLANGAPQACGIQVTLRGKADFFEDVFGNDAPAALKNIDQIHLFTSIFQTPAAAQVQFTGNVVNDLSAEFPITTQIAQIYPPPGPRWGTFAEGGSNFKWGSPPTGSGQLWTYAPLGAGLYYDLPLLSPAGAWGKIIQMEFSEYSQYGWLILGFALQASKNEVIQ
jgi:hypothetical protein